jgi:uncharacterized protein YkuJ
LQGDITVTKKRLPPAQQFELRYLKQQESKWSEERFKPDGDKNAQVKHFQAREELTLFVSKLRKQGYNI